MPNEGEQTCQQKTGHGRLAQLLLRVARMLHKHHWRWMDRHIAWSRKHATQAEMHNKKHLAWGKTKDRLSRGDGR